MIVTIEYTEQTRRTIERHGRRIAELPVVLSEALGDGAAAGADEVRRSLVMGESELTMRNPGQGGLASCVFGWMLDPTAPLAAIGVPSNTPAAAYAGIQEHGGTIRPKPGGRALAIPVSDEAEMFDSPIDHEQATGELVLIRRASGPPLLIRPNAGGADFELHWVLVPSVEIRATHWLSEGVQAAAGIISDAAQGRINRWLDSFGGGN